MENQSAKILLNQPDKILIVDDEPLILFSLRRLFKKHNIDIDVETDSIKALELARINNYKLIICDYKMPNLNGVDLLKLIKETSPDSIRIMISALVSQEALPDIINQCEVFKFINKPWNDNNLIQIVQESIKKFDDANCLLFRQDIEHVPEEQISYVNDIPNFDYLSLLPAIDLKTLDLPKQVNLYRTEMFQHLDAIINMVSPKIFSHGQRVSKLCGYVAKYLKLSEEQQKNIFFAGLYHDIGKLFELTAQIDHQQLSHTILNNFNELKGASLIVQKHHLNLATDSSAAIESKILAIVDHFDKKIHATSKNDEKTIILTDIFAEMFDHPELFDQTTLISFKEIILNDFKLTAFFNERKIHLTDMEEGLVLSRPLYTVEGKMLLSAEYRLTKDIIIRIFGHNKMTPIRLPLYVYEKNPEKPFNYNEFLESKIKISF